MSMQEELNQFERNKVWTLVPIPHGKTIIGTKWIFKNKMDETRLVIRNKARLVAQGYRQEEGIDYDETFVPVHTTMNTLGNSRILLRRSKSKETDAETQHAGESVAIADTTTSLDGFESTKKLKNQPKTAYSIEHVDVDVTFIGSFEINKVMGVADSDLESMPDDKVMSVLGYDDDDSEGLYVADEIVADNVLDKLANITNIGDTNTVSTVSTSAPLTSQEGCSSTNF
nr:retrovirus-related Pol polyprotein from transposon TNT 1-94 [Tanacetum cinerariifolium]